HILLELPSDRQAVGGNAAVVAAWNLCRQHREEFAVRIPTRQRLVKKARSVLVLCAHREMRIKQPRALPPPHPAWPPAAPLTWLVLKLRLRTGDAAIVEHPACHRRRETESDHPIDEGTAR